ncbi:FAD-dependent monooxygenase yanF [Pseudocercospora fuligena]|uniref:FAD-dependent monooxygenase yanF n=1 Tax=Pseudocercospora fuligena TaxID=685502 RepID=A0A8H6RI49_9PEZI|nr:FAD-dependent monooxygenase yanF [Pseudocercospora fuligena]
MWGGTLTWSLKDSDAVMDAFVNYSRADTDNSDSSVILGMANHSGEWVWHADVQYLDHSTRPKAGHLLRKFLDIPLLDSSTGPLSQLSRTQQIADLYPAGLYNGYWTWCTRANKEILRFFADTWREEVAAISDVPGILESGAFASVQCISSNVLRAMSRDGGNALHLDSNESPLFLFVMEPYWYDGSQNDRVRKAEENLLIRTQEEARRRGLFHSFVYQNYADPRQDVFAGYGKGAVEFLRGVSSRYDPHGVFQYQRASGFHLHGATQVNEK